MKLELARYDAALPDDVYLALAITGGIEDGDQRHTGFLVRSFDDENFLFHLGFNNGYLKNPLTSRYDYLLVPALEPETANSIITFLVMLLEDTGGNVQYSIAWEAEEYFDKDGKLTKFAAVDGFTCATFVLETMKRYGLELVDRETWPLTEETATWQANILEKLQLPVEQYLAQFEVLGKYPRIKPEEALGAAHYYRGDLLPYPIVLPAGVEVVSEMRRLKAP